MIKSARTVLSVLLLLLGASEDLPPGRDSGDLALALGYSVDLVDQQLEPLLHVVVCLGADLDALDAVLLA